MELLENYWDFYTTNRTSLQDKIKNFDRNGLFVEKMNFYVSKSSIGTTCFLSFTAIVNKYAILIRTTG
jgi:hypothetical protein